jgi:hypothetical protein
MNKNHLRRAQRKIGSRRPRLLPLGMAGESGPPHSKTGRSSAAPTRRGAILPAGAERGSGRRQQWLLVSEPSTPRGRRQEGSVRQSDVLKERAATNAELEPDDNGVMRLRDRRRESRGGAKQSTARPSQYGPRRNGTTGDSAVCRRGSAASASGRVGTARPGGAGNQLLRSSSSSGGMAEAVRASDPSAARYRFLSLGPSG